MIIASYDGISPNFRGDVRHGGDGASVLGRATIGHSAWLGASSLIRADGNTVDIGDDFHLGAHGTVHIQHDLYPTVIGDHVTAGDNSIIHACIVGSDCVIGRDAIILDGSEVGDGVVLADGAVVFPRSKLEGGWLYEGQPAKKVREIAADERHGWHARIRAAAPSSPPDADEGSFTIDADGFFFLAASAKVTGTVRAADGASIWFGCIVEAGRMGLELGANVNVQDNTVIRSIDHRVVIGERTTIGHNVSLVDCEIAEDSLIGMGAHVAANTIVERNVLLAAGARTTAGQVLEEGWLYGGSPARQLSRLDDAKRGVITMTPKAYRLYAGKFASEPGAFRTI